MEKKQKKKFYTEAAYLLGVLTLAIGASLMEKAGFGLSMVVAPAYILHLKLAETVPFFSFGMAEYCLQAVLLLLMIAVVLRFRLTYLFSFVTAVLYGFTLDGCIALCALLPSPSFAGRIVFFLIGMFFCSVGVALVFHTYIAPEVYELFVKEVAGKFGWNIHKVKTVYDCISCFVSVLLSFLFFGLWHFEGVKAGTVFCAFVNGYTISLCSRFFEKHFDFTDRLPLRRFFETK